MIDAPEQINLDDLVQRGIKHSNLGQISEALELLGTALLYLPHDAEVLEHYGKSLAQNRQESEAVEYLERAVKIAPCSYSTLCVLGAVYGALGRYEDGLSVLNRCLSLAPELPAARWNRAHLLLTLGHWRQGWEDYQFGLVNRMRFMRSVKPKWDGKRVEGKRLLIYSEQGYGDTVWALRLLSMAKERAGCYVILEVQESLYTLCSHSKLAVDEIWPQKRDLHSHFAYDLQCSLMDLPYVLGIDVHTELPKERYLSADPQLAAAWQKGVKGRIGLAWKGSSTHSNDANRSMAKEWLLPLEGEGFVSLQKGDSAPFEMQEIGEELSDFSVSAAVIENLDAVVTVDTSIAHVAAAMGKPVLLMIPQVIDFRWLLDREDSPWYPSIRIFRQTKRGDWSDVVQGVKEALNG